MSNKGGKARFAPGGREYEKRKAQNKRRGFKKTDGEEKKREEDEEDIEEEGEEGSEEGSEEEEEVKSKATKKEKEEDDDEEDEEDDEEGEEGDDEWKKKSSRSTKPKGLQGVIEVSNPNREVKQNLKASEISKLVQNPGMLSRREKEALEKQKQQNRIEKSDLVRLAQIRKDREAAAKKREEEKNAKDQPKTKDGIKKLTV